MSEFYLVDLVSQRDVVRSHLRGLSVDEVLLWLAARGQLVRQDVYGRARAIFFFDGDDLVFVGEHTTFR